MDADYIEKSASRLYDVRRGTEKQSFLYPDLLTWIPPKSAIDVLAVCGEGCKIAGLGRGRPIGSEAHSPSEIETCWQWIQLEFGQGLLAKRRCGAGAPGTQPVIVQSQPPIAKSEPGESPGGIEQRLVGDAVEEVVRSRFEAGLFGRSFMRLARNVGVHAASQFASEVARRMKSGH